ncbi:MAG: hypothetical protein JRJ83_17335 [Deltaproteobacteria bacterium]|nr:hypothetical protein [Deltaproteobacteria bacterium]
MENQCSANQFREDEIVIMSHWDKKNGEWVRTVYPKIGGRLRLAHEDNDNLSITTEIIKYDENIAVVRAVSTTTKGSFPGIGMSSTERDDKIAPAILELAETRAIARSLRFAGYGVEYCSAEEISHLENGNGKLPSKSTNQKGGNGEKGNNGGNGENSRITNKQLNYAVNLGKNLGWNSKDLDEEAIKTYGVKMAYLSVKDASSFIDILKSKMD